MWNLFSNIFILSLALFLIACPDGRNAALSTDLLQVSNSLILCDVPSKSGLDFCGKTDNKIGQLIRRIGGRTC
jgi:hypothetical protein